MAPQRSGRVAPEWAGRVAVWSAVPAYAELLAAGLRDAGIVATVTSGAATAPELSVLVAYEPSLEQLTALQAAAPPELRTIVVTGRGARGVPRAAGATRAVPHVVEPTVSLARLADCIADDCDDRAHLPPEDGAADRVLALTGREREVLRWLMTGRPRSHVARQLQISPHTLRTHIQNVFEKTGVHSQLEAAAVGFQVGLSAAGESPAAAVDGTGPVDGTGSSDGRGPADSTVLAEVS